MQEWIILLTGLAVGLIIGLTSFGGPLLIPSMALFAGVPVHHALSAAMASYVASGCAAAWVFSRKAAIDWQASKWLAFGAMPGALLGALSVSLVSASVLEILIGAVSLVAGARILLRAGGDGGHLQAPSYGLLLGVGTAVGFGSALTGTGGPLLLAPILSALGLPILTVIGLSQAIQIPIAFLATAGNALAGNVDVHVSVVLACGMLLGAIAGARIAQRIRTRVLSRVVAALMVAFGLFFVARALTAL